MNDFTFDSNADLSVVRVIGLGADAPHIAERLNAAGYRGLLAEAICGMNDLALCGNERFAVVFASDRLSEAARIADSLKESGIFTVLIVADAADGQESLAPSVSVAVVSHERIFESIKVIADTILLQGPINVDFNDLRMTLEGVSRFNILTSRSGGCEDRIASALTGLNADLNAFGPDVKRMLITVMFNPALEPRLAMSEMTALSDMVGSMPDADVVWGVLQNPDMPADALVLNMVVAFD